MSKHRNWIHHLQSGSCNIHCIDTKGVKEWVIHGGRVSTYKGVELGRGDTLEAALINAFGESEHNIPFAHILFSKRDNPCQHVMDESCEEIFGG